MGFSLPRVVGGALLVAGTAIGAGMLALPVVTGAGGFLPAIVIYLLCWIFSACTGLLLLEVCLWMPNDANLISMAHHLLGPIGKVGAWILYLFLFYCLMIGYVAEGGHFILALFGGSIPYLVGTLLFVGLFGTCVYLGTQVVDRINFILMIGLGVSYFIFIFLGLPEVQVSFLRSTHWFAAFMGLPVIFTSFSYQGVIPSLTTYMERNPKAVRLAIIGGTAFPFLAYVIWEFLILGLVPIDGSHGLLEANVRGWTAVEPLRFIFAKSPIYAVGQFFGAFAVTTSFLGVSLGLFDFLSDGLQIPKVGKKKIFLSLLIFVPPLIISQVNPTIFLTALGYAGGIGCALLLGLLPVLMVWVGRYVKGYSAIHRQLRGGKVVLFLLAGFVVFELVIQLIKEVSK